MEKESVLYKGNMCITIFSPKKTEEKKNYINVIQRA